MLICTAEVSGTVGHAHLYCRGLRHGLRATAGLGAVVLHELGVLSLGTLTSLGPSWAVRALATSLDVDLGQSGTVGAGLLLHRGGGASGHRSGESLLLGPEELLGGGLLDSGHGDLAEVLLLVGLVKLLLESVVLADGLGLGSLVELALVLGVVASVLLGVHLGGDELLGGLELGELGLEGGLGLLDNVLLGLLGELSLLHLGDGGIVGLGGGFEGGGGGQVHVLLHLLLLGSHALLGLSESRVMGSESQTSRLLSLHDGQLLGSGLGGVEIVGNLVVVGFLASHIRGGCEVGWVRGEGVGEPRGTLLEGGGGHEVGALGGAGAIRADDLTLGALHLIVHIRRLLVSRGFVVIGDNTALHGVGELVHLRVLDELLERGHGLSHDILRSAAGAEREGGKSEEQHDTALHSLV